MLSESKDINICSQNINQNVTQGDRNNGYAVKRHSKEKMANQFNLQSYKRESKDGLPDMDDIPQQQCDLPSKMAKLSILGQHALTASQNKSLQQNYKIHIRQFCSQNQSNSYSFNPNEHKCLENNDSECLQEQSNRVDISQQKFHKKVTSNSKDKYNDRKKNNLNKHEKSQSKSSISSQEQPLRKHTSVDKNKRQWKKKSERINIQEAMKNSVNEENAIQFYEVHQNAGRRQQITEKKNIDLSEFNGKGILIVKGGKKYEGNWVGGTLMSPVKVTYPNGDIYNGDIVRYKKHGKGELSFANGKKYIGEFGYGDIDGYGIYYSKNGEVLAEGEWKRGKFFR